MKKILHVANLDTMLMAFRMDLLQHLKEIGYEVHIASKISKPNVKKEFIDKGFVVHDINIGRGLDPLKATKAIIRLRKVIAKQKYVIVHTNTPSGGLIGRLAAYFANVPKIYHTTAGFYFHENMGKIQYKFYSKIEKALGRITHVLFSPNQEDINTCYELGIKPKDKIVWCGPSGVKMNRYDINLKEEFRESVLKELNLEHDTFVIGSIGRMNWEKGFKEFVLTLKKLKSQGLKIHAVCAGRGKHADEIIDFVKEHECSDIFSFIGYTTEVPKYLMAFDVLLFPSYREGFPITTLESMAAQTPVIAFDIRGSRESIIDGETGYIVPFKNVNELVTKTSYLYKNKEIKMAMGISGRKRVLDKFTKIHHIENQMPYY